MSRTRFRLNVKELFAINGWVFVYELSGRGFESDYSHLILCCLRVCSLVVSDLRSETTGSRFEFGCYPAGTQNSGNIRWVFSQRCNVRDIQGKIREHFKGKYFSKNYRWKVAFMLKMYDLTIANVDFLANSSNHKAMFPEYLKNIPRISVSKIFQGYPGNIARL